MKPYIIIIFFFTVFTVQGQNKADTTLSKWRLDSLLSAQNNLKGTFVKQGFACRLLVETTRIDTLHYGRDSTIIHFWANEGKLLKRIKQRKNENGCVTYETDQFYNRAGLLEYAESRRSSCGIPTNTDPEVTVFSGMDTEYLRFEYDNLGRIVQRVWWYYSIGTRRYSYSYDEQNKQTVTRTYIAQNEFWK